MNHYIYAQILNMQAMAKTFGQSCELAAMKDDGQISKDEVKQLKRIKVWGDRIFEKCGIGRDERGDGGKTLEIRGKRRLSARDGGANYQQS